MIILGIDPGTAKTGYAVVEVNGNKKPILLETNIVETSADYEMHKRLKVLYKNLNILGKKYSPNIMIIEKLFFNTNAKTAISVGQARGVSLLMAANRNMKVYEYTALEAKLILTGYGRSDKKKVQEAVRQYMGLKDIVKPDDANDAVAIVLCFLRKGLLIS